MFEKQYMTDPRDKYVDSEIFVDVSTRDLPLSRWTTVSQDDRQMNHLLTMFFTWDNIVERAFYRPIFEEDTITMDPHLPDNHPKNFCSRFLINALLAVSCVSQLLSSGRAEPNILALHPGSRVLQRAPRLFD